MGRTREGSQTYVRVDAGAVSIGVVIIERVSGISVVTVPLDRVAGETAVVVPLSAVVVTREAVVVTLAKVVVTLAVVVLVVGVLWPAFSFPLTLSQRSIPNGLRRNFKGYISMVLGRTTIRCRFEK